MADKKHILFISSWYPNRLDPTLGIFNKYFTRAAALYNKISVINVSSEQNLLSEHQIAINNDDQILTVSVYYEKVSMKIPVLSKLLKRKKVLSSFEKGYEEVVMRAGKPDIIQLNVVMPMGIGALHLAKKHKLPYVINENWSGYTREDNNYRGLLAKYYTKKIVAGASFILPTSSYLKEAMLSHQLKGNYRIVPNVVDTNVFRPAEINENKGNRLLHISSLNDREKNVSGLIRAFAAASKSNNELTLKIVGEGIDKLKYQQLVKELNLESKVIFLGRLFARDLVAELNHSDALIMFSNYETFCLVIIEAFACGKPVITSNAGAIKTYMTPELGIMVEKGDEAALTKAILDFSRNNNRYDHSYIRKYAVDNYSYEKVGRVLDEIYTEAIEQSKNKI